MFVLRDHRLLLIVYSVASLFGLSNGDDDKMLLAAGHGITFKPGTHEGTLLKLSTGNEEDNLRILMNDKLGTFVPKFYGASVDEDGKRYIEMQDLTSTFSKPQIMDIKMGCRTFVEEEVFKVLTKKAEPRADFYEKLIQEDPSALTEREHTLKGVTKARYRQWRDQKSTSASLGFRISGIVFSDGSKKRDEFKILGDQDKVSEIIWSFMDKNPAIKKQYLDRLRSLRQVIIKSRFFMNHEFLGSSLLFLHDNSKANVWLIDLARTNKLPDDVEVSHLSEWRMGNHEDCYLTGLNNLIHIISNLS